MPDITERIAGVRAEIASLTTRMQPLRERLSVLHAELRDLEDAQARTQIAELGSADVFWEDAEFRSAVILAEWAGGRGNARWNDYIAQAIAELAPGAFYSFCRTTSGDEMRIYPQLVPSRGCSIDDVAQALLFMLPRLSPDGEPLPVAVLSGDDTSPSLLVHSAEHTDLLHSHYLSRSGTLAEMLKAVVRDYPA